MLRRRRRDHAAIEANLTSLIDVTFLLIVFFVLVSRLNDIELIELDLPRPQDSIAAALESENQVVINVLPAEDGALRGAGGTSGYRVGVLDVTPDRAGIDAMTAHLVGLYRINPRLDVNVRADRSTHYEHVEPVLRAVSAAARSVPGASGRANLMVIRDQ